MVKNSLIKKNNMTDIKNIVISIGIFLLFIIYYPILSILYGLIFFIVIIIFVFTKINRLKSYFDNGRLSKI